MNPNLERRLYDVASLGIDRLDEEDRSRVGPIDADWSIRWLGHSSFFVENKGDSLLFDPVFRNWIGCFKRRCSVFGNPTEMCPDAIFVSHAHMDHMDLDSLRLFEGIPIYLPAGSERFLTRDLADQARPVSLGETVALGKGTKVTALEAMHGGWRYPWQKGLKAVSYVLEKEDRCLFFCGDSAWGPHFSSIGRRFDIDWALLPIGAYSPRWFLKSRHLNPEVAVEAFWALRGRMCIPYHFGAYRLSLEPIQEPLPRFARAAKHSGVDWRLPIDFFRAP